MRGRVLLATVLGAGAVAIAAPPPPPEPVRVFAAASLAESFREVARELEASGATIELNLAGSQVLRTQIEHGAAAEVYAFADVEDAVTLQARGLVQPPHVFALNSLCVVTPASGGRVRSLADLAQPGLKVVLAAPAVPAGRYADQALRRMEAAGSGAGFRARVLANVVSRETNVRLVLAKVALGEADAGLVYASDAFGQPRVRALPIPEHLNATARYGIGLVRADARAEARAFVQAVTGPSGRRVLAARGFRLP